MTEVLARFLTVVPEAVSAESIETDAGCAAFLRELRGHILPLLAPGLDYDIDAAAAWVGAEVLSRLP